nr:AP2-like ethylene-responsive transcription factor At2g41710 isoform X4 [Ipomoea batatas]
MRIRSGNLNSSEGTVSTMASSSSEPTCQNPQKEAVAMMFVVQYECNEEAAARAMILLLLKYWGPGTLINFPQLYHSGGSTSLVKADSYVKGHQEKPSMVFEDTGNEVQNCKFSPNCHTYEMPRLGLSQKGKSHKAPQLPAMRHLSQCAAYKNLQEKTPFFGRLLFLFFLRDLHVLLSNSPSFSLSVTELPQVEAHGAAAKGVGLRQAAVLFKGGAEAADEGVEAAPGLVERAGTGSRRLRLPKKRTGSCVNLSLPELIEVLEELKDVGAAAAGEE